jgi:asparagine synthase (glutamine-hydrolysing)
MIRYLGIVNYLNDISQSDNIEKVYENLKNKFNINQKLDLFKTEHINLSNGFLNKSFDKDKYVIMYNGSVYNIKDVKKDLQSRGYKFNTKTKLKKEKVIPLQNIDNYLEAEVLLTSYHEYKEKFLEHLNGAFSICIYDKTNNIIFLSRDRIGIKPLYYTKNKLDNSFIFSTNIKDILSIPNMKAILDKQGTLELIGIGPIHSPGFTYFKDIYELLPGHYAIYSNIGLITHKYWDINTKKCNDDETKCISNLYTLIKKSIKLQIMDSKKIGIISPENINSSIILPIASKLTPHIQTYTYSNISNSGSKKNKDSEYIKLIKKNLKIDNYNFTSNTKVLSSLLIPAMMARDMPGMAYLDSCNLEFYSLIKENGTDKCIYNDAILKLDNNFPLDIYKNIRGNLLNKNIANEQILDEYINLKYNEIIKDITYLNDEDQTNKEIRKNKYVNLKLYINSLVERINYISSNLDLEILLPYLDYRIIEYIYNVPNNLDEKYILNKIFDKNYPNLTLNSNNLVDIYDQDYINTLEHEIKKILNDSDSKILKIIDKSYILQIIDLKKSENKGENIISYAELLAYLIQTEYWLNIYDIEFE